MKDHNSIKHELSNTSPKSTGASTAESHTHTGRLLSMPRSHITLRYVCAHGSITGNLPQINSLYSVFKIPGSGLKGDSSSWIRQISRISNPKILTFHLVIIQRELEVELLNFKKLSFTWLWEK